MYMYVCMYVYIYIYMYVPGVLLPQLLLPIMAGALN